MRWRRPPDPELAARVELFLQNQGTTPVTLSKSAALLFDGKSPEELVSSSSWAWHDSPRSWLEESVELPPDCLTVIAFNGRSADWGVGTKHTIQLGDKSKPAPFALDPPEAWLSAVTFLSVDAGRPFGRFHLSQPDCGSRRERGQTQTGIEIAEAVAARRRLDTSCLSVVARVHRTRSVSSQWNCGRSRQGWLRHHLRPSAARLRRSRSARGFRGPAGTVAVGTSADQTRSVRHQRRMDRFRHRRSQ